MGLKCNIHNRGFTLIEVVVATAILTIGIAVVVRAFSQCVQVSALSSDTMFAVMLARNQFEELAFQESMGKVTLKKVEPSKMNNNISLAYEITRDPVSNLYFVDLMVAWERLRIPRSLNFTAYLR